ncbi:MAG: hypothetical protein JW925_00105, partial [Syntrophaceae bacterium]|nr:hypothetical protein [Syntrophaceae bacterium]
MKSRFVGFLCIMFVVLFVGSSLAALPLKDKSAYANLPRSQHLKKTLPNGDFTYVVKMGTLAPEGVGWA